MNLEPIIECGVNEDCCQLFKRLIVTDSLGNIYINSLWGLGARENGSFLQKDLKSVVIDGDSHVVYEIDHSLGTMQFGLSIRDNNGVQQSANIYVYNDAIVYLILDKTITGTWTYEIFY